MGIDEWLFAHQKWIACILIGITFFGFLWGKIRYDVIALGSLLAFVLFKIIPIRDTFSGFSHPAVITVAAVLVLSRAIADTGVTNYATKHLIRFADRPSVLIFLLAGLVAALSGIMNDVGALALVLPIALQISNRYKIAPSLLLMPLAFASLLGGTMTVIGTPPNLIISHYRAEIGIGEFGMFDFLPVGIVVTVVGLIYISVLGWRFLPERKHSSGQSQFETDAYIIEMRILPQGKLENKSITQMIEISKANIRVVALMRGARRLIDPVSTEILMENDTLLIEGQPDDIKSLQSLTGLVFATSKIQDSKQAQSKNQETIEAIINPGARIAERILSDLNLRQDYGVNVLGISRQGATIRQRLSKVILKPGDILIIQGDPNTLAESLQAIGCLPLAERANKIKPSSKLIPTLSIFAIAVGLVVFKVLPAHISFPLAVFALLSTHIMSLKTAYASIEGSLIILLGCFITVGKALEATGITSILVNWLVEVFSGAPGFVMIGLILLCAMLLTDVINNSATAVILAPIAVGIAQTLGHNVDPYLMAVCIGCSCAFNTPIGHHSNTLVMGPGGYKFGDYWKMGLLLDALLLVTVTPALIYFWPLN